MNNEDIEFLKIWLRALKEIDSDAFGKTNKFVAIFDNRFVGIDQDENVYVGKREDA